MDTSPPDALPGKPTFVPGCTSRAKLWSSLGEVCRLLGILPFERDGLVFQHLTFRPGQRVYTAAKAFESLFVIRSGLLKTVVCDDAGHEQVLAFAMQGEILGLDGICAKAYQSEAIAQVTSEVVVLPFKILLELGAKIPEFDVELLSVMSREIVRQQRLICVLCGRSAETRVAEFLCSLAERFASAGKSGTQLTLRMTRYEIGIHLGLALESVSRALQTLQQQGVISVDKKIISIHRPEILRTMCTRQARPCGRRARRRVGKRDGQEQGRGRP